MKADRTRQVGSAMSDAMAWARGTGCTGVAVWGTVGGIPWWIVVLALAVGLGPEIRATAQTVSDIAWKWRHPDCACHSQTQSHVRGRPRPRRGRSSHQGRRERHYATPTQTPSETASTRHRPRRRPASGP